MTHTVIGFFRNSSDAHEAAAELKSHGFDNSNIDISPAYGSYEDETNRRERTGKVGSFFKNLFRDNDEDVNRYSEAARDNYLLTVHAYDETQAERASEILDQNGAIDVNESYTGRSSEYSGLSSDSEYPETKDRDFNSPSLSDVDRTEASIPIIEEEVNVGKRQVRRGGVRLRSRIVERPVEETLRLREEHVQVERTPVDRDASDAEMENFREETIEVNEYSEEPIISKKARVVEEVKVGKKVSERKETVRGTKRKTEVDIEDLDKNPDERSSDVE
jgi:uncharacterized protein (TIGR02271 family)